MRKTLALTFLVFIGMSFLYFTYRAIESWLSVERGPATITFDGNDTKLMLGWGVVLAALLYFAIWPKEFQSNQRRGPTRFGLKQTLFIAMTISGILSLQKFVFSNGYLGKAEEYANRHGYSVVCNEIGYKFGSELIMAKSESDCGKA